MNETIRQYWERTTQYWNQLNKSQKIMICAVVISILFTIALLTFNMSKTEYSVAYTNLNASDAAAIREHLNNIGIPYRFSADGTAIGVPTKNVTEVKIDVESQNLINSGSIGYGLFRDNISSFGMTDNQFDLLSVDAKSGEIEQLINSISGVMGSKVLLTEPKQTVFINPNETETASASVVVQFRPGATVDQNKIDTIYNLVHRSVANLPLENITISNQEHEMLPSSRLEGGMDNSTNAANQQFTIKKQYELDIQKNVESFLARILGPDRVVVHVVSTLNFDQRNTQERLFTPVNLIDQTGIERSISEIQRSYTSESGDEAGGVPGMGTGDIPNYPASSATGANSSSEEMEIIVNYEVNEINNSIIASPFVVEDLTIFAGIEPIVPDDPESLTEETKEQIHSMLVNIIGTSLANSGKQFSDDELNRKVSVISQSFHGTQGVALNAQTSNAWLYGLAAAALLIGAAGGYFLFRRRTPSVVEEDLELSEGLDGQPSIDFETVTKENQTRKQLESLAQKKPDEFVDLLRTWLVDD